MTEPLKPALTDEQWAALRSDYEVFVSENHIVTRDCKVVELGSADSVIAALNFQKSEDDPTKITRTWVDAVRAGAAEFEARHDSEGDDYLSGALYERFTTLNAMADALEAYLPKEQP